MTLDRYLRLPEVLHVTGLGRTTIWEREKAGTFPLRTRLGGKAVGWRESAILAWMGAPAGPEAPEPRRRRNFCTCRHDSGMSTACEMHYPSS